MYATVLHRVYCTCSYDLPIQTIYNKCLEASVEWCLTNKYNFTYLELINLKYEDGTNKYWFDIHGDIMSNG